MALSAGWPDIHLRAGSAHGESWTWALILIAAPPMIVALARISLVRGGRDASGTKDLPRYVSGVVASGRGRPARSSCQV